MKVLIGCVGINEPKSDRGPGPLYRIICKVMPDRLHLLYTEPGTHTNLLSLVSALEWASDTVEEWPLPADVHDWTAQHTAIDQIWRMVLDQFQGAEIHLALTGAPTIREVLLLCTSGFPVHVWQARDNGDVHLVDMRRRLEDLAIRRARTLAGQHHYALAAQVLETEVLPSAANERSARAQAAINLCRAIDRWDQYEFSKAQGYLTQLADPEVESLRTGMLRLLQSGPVVPLTDGVELYLNMRRRLEQGLYVDALARFRRLYEKLLRQALGAKAGRKDSIPTLVDKLPTDPRGENALDIGVCLARGERLVDLRAAAWEFCDLRNKTISAHGDQPVDQVTAERASQAGLHIIAALCGVPLATVEQAIAQHPLGDLTPFLNWLNEV